MTRSSVTDTDICQRAGFGYFCGHGTGHHKARSVLGFFDRLKWFYVNFCAVLCHPTGVMRHRWVE